MFPELLKGGENHEPYIFSKEELSRLFNRLDQLDPNNYTTGYMVFPVLFRTVYGCGLRISEALKLQKADVDIAGGLLHIRHGKNDKERILPVSRSLQQRLSVYMGLAHKGTSPETPFFYAKAFQPYSYSAVHNQFKGFLWDVGITYRGKDFGPRIHDLRHSYAVAALQSGDDIKTVQENLGHYTAAFTLDVYGHVTDKMRQDSADRMQKYIDIIHDE